MGLTGGKGGGKNALAAKPNLLSALRVQTSAYGQVIPIVYGQNRISDRLIWAGDFKAIPHTSTQKVGGKGLGSGGGNAIVNTTYTYQTAVAMALCVGPIQNIHNVWDTKGRLTLVTTSAVFTVPGGGGSFTPPGDGRIFHSGRGVSRADAYSFSQTDYGSDGSALFSGTQQNPMALVGSSPGAGQYTLNTTTGVHTFAAADAGKVMTITYTYSFPDSNSNGQPQQKLSLTLFLGSRPQTPWSYLTSAHPGQDLGYNGIAYVAASAMDLGSSGTLPNLSFEVLGLLPFGAGITDAEPSAIINDILGNVFYGLAGVVPLGSLTQYRNFCVANGFFISPVLDAQKSAAAWIQEILDITNSAAVWSEGVLKIIPYGDTTAVGNGATFIPNTSPIYDLTTNDLLSEVKIKRPSVADVMNSVSVEFANRANDYNVDVAEDKDEAAIAVFGLRKAQPVTAHHITTATIAKQVANFKRKRQIEIRSTYTFNIGWQFNLLEPMDLVTLTIPELGYNKKPVRITAMREDAAGNIEVDCEEFPWGTASPTLYPQQVPGATPTAANNDPGQVAAPIIFEAPDRLSVSGEYEIWMGVCGGNLSVTGATNASPIQITTSAAHGYKSGTIKKVAGVLGNAAANGTWLITVVDATNFTLNGSSGSGAYTSGGIVLGADWGGCRVWLSVDATNYQEIGRIFGPARMGSYTANLGILADPDQITISAISRTSNVVTVTLSAPAIPTGLIAAVNVLISGVTDTSFNGTFLIASVISSTQFTYAQTAANASSSGGLVQEVLQVDLTQSGGALASGTQADADNFRTICMISGATVPELISYQTATLTAASKYNLTYLRRGIFGTVLNVHAPDTFLRLDEAVFIAQIDPTLVGKTLHFKFTSFNVFGLMEQSLANATDYTFAFTGLYNNGGFASNDGTADSINNAGACNIRIYLSPTPGTSYHAYKPDGTTRTIAAQTLTLDSGGTALAFSTQYYLTYSLVRGTHRAYLAYSDYVAGANNGEMRIGTLTTIAAGGGGGISGGGGQHGGGGGKGGSIAGNLV